MTTISYTSTPDSEILADVGRKLRGLRGSLSQARAAQLAGLTRQTVIRAERGDNPTLLTIVRLLRAYGRVNALGALIPSPTVSPMALLRARRRAAAGGRRQDG
jgi:DNA-binding XRE family transcriptional regulator